MPLIADALEDAREKAREVWTAHPDFNGPLAFRALDARDREMIRAYLSHPAVRAVFDTEREYAHFDERRFDVEGVLQAIGGDTP